jgi:hypothetical protein
MYDTEYTYVAMTYSKRVYNYLGTSEGSVLNVNPSDGFAVFMQLSSYERKLLRRGWLKQKTLSNKELLIVLKRQINFDSDQTTGRNRLLCHV